MIKKIKTETIYLLMLFIILTAALKIIFIREPIPGIIRITASLFWLFIIPGYSLMLYWAEKLDFAERLIAGTALALAITGVIGYNLSVLGLHMKYHPIILPITMLAAAGLIIVRKTALQVSLTKTGNK
ncbi:hypothetical protein HYU11_06485 [Candidatus Woesearchaeota archaeon]|nr:hypothetical protein [Candidatus Woesearchaeota archaeon]